jgi:hypothetical protein
VGKKYWLSPVSIICRCASRFCHQQNGEKCHRRSRGGRNGCRRAAIALAKLNRVEPLRDSAVPVATALQVLPLSVDQLHKSFVPAAAEKLKITAACPGALADEAGRFVRR